MLRIARLYGVPPHDRQIRRLREGVDIVVATPGRLEDLIDRGSLRTDDIEVIVLDEADHLCDLGFFPVVDGLLDQTPPQGQRLLLSATLDGDVDRLVRKHLRDPRTDHGHGVVRGLHGKGAPGGRRIEDGLAGEHALDLVQRV